MTLIGVYLSIPEWYTVANTLLQAGEKAEKTARHILDEIGFGLDVAPEYYAPRRDTCANCKNSRICTVTAALPICQHYERKVL